MKRVLIISRHGSARGPIAAACIARYSKVSVQVCGLVELRQDPLPELKDCMLAGGLVMQDNEVFESKGFKPGEFDYVVSVCDEAKHLAEMCGGSALLFNYHFAELIAKEKTEKERLTELNGLITEMKLYFERFCKLYLNEFV